MGSVSVDVSHSNTGGNGQPLFVEEKGPCSMTVGGYVDNSGPQCCWEWPISKVSGGQPEFVFAHAQESHSLNLRVHVYSVCCHIEVVGKQTCTRVRLRKLFVRKPFA